MLLMLRVLSNASNYTCTYFYTYIHTCCRQVTGHLCFSCCGSSRMHSISSTRQQHARDCALQGGVGQDDSDSVRLLWVRLRPRHSKRGIRGNKGGLVCFGQACICTCVRKHAYVHINAVMWWSDRHKAWHSFLYECMYIYIYTYNIYIYIHIYTYTHFIWHEDTHYCIFFLPCSHVCCMHVSMCVYDESRYDLRTCTPSCGCICLAYTSCECIHTTSCVCMCLAYTSCVCIHTPSCVCMCLTIIPGSMIVAQL
jgi:hypothetical protein